MGEMGAGIAHELNSPIAGILSIAEVLIGRLSSADPNYFLLQKIKDAAVRSKYIILDMLTYSRPKKGEFVPIYMNETIRATLTIFVSELKASSIEIVEDFDPELPKVNANQGQLMEVILNILKNAKDASGDNGKVFITTRTRDEEGKTYVVAEIRDTGPGIPDGVIDRIFDPFFSTKEKGGGVNIGLGLSIAQSIVKEHGGRIEVENAGGAVFRVVLPVAEAAEKA
jgi:signal transduction histidine kinase